MNYSDTYDKKTAIIVTTWEYLLRTGLAHASIGELCRETKLAQSSLYHWFENKDDIWISAGKYGISKVVDALFNYTLNHAEDIRKYFDTILDEVEKYKYEIRLAIQITTNPVFGDRMRDKAKDFRLWYESYAEKLMSIFDCSYVQAETFIYSIIAYVIDYAIWDDRDKTQMLLENLYDRVLKTIDAQPYQSAEEDPMELLDAILIVTECECAEQLKDLSPERKLKLADSLEERVPGGLASIGEWNELLMLFMGAPPESKNKVAKEKLLRYLRGEE